MGPECYFEYKFPEMGMIVLISFTFGSNIPILFPIALVALCVYYFLSKYRLAYFYRKPYNLSNKINKAFITNCELLPAVYAAIGFWVWSNRQIYENEADALASRYSQFDPKHNMWQTLTSIHPGSPMLILLLYTIYYRITPQSWHWHLVRL